ncbi:unnamed protein product, partial [marine sediment metagenome]
VRLNYCDQADTIKRILDLVRPFGDKVESKAEEVLTVGIASDSRILVLIPPPTRPLRRIVELLDTFGEPDHPHIN